MSGSSNSPRRASVASQASISGTTQRNDIDSINRSKESVRSHHAMLDYYMKQSTTQGLQYLKTFESTLRILCDETNSTQIGKAKPITVGAIITAIRQIHPDVVALAVSLGPDSCGLKEGSDLLSSFQAIQSVSNSPSEKKQAFRAPDTAKFVMWQAEWNSFLVKIDNMYQIFSPEKIQNLAVHKISGDVLMWMMDLVGNASNKQLQLLKLTYKDQEFWQLAKDVFPLMIGGGMEASKKWVDLREDPDKTLFRTFAVHNLTSIPLEILESSGNYTRSGLTAYDANPDDASSLSST